MNEPIFDGRTIAAIVGSLTVMVSAIYTAWANRRLRHEPEPLPPEPEAPPERMVVPAADDVTFLRESLARIEAALRHVTTRVDDEREQELSRARVLAAIHADLTRLTERLDRIAARLPPVNGP